jgi:hypothetical protein
MQAGPDEARRGRLAADPRGGVRQQGGPDPRGPLSRVPPRSDGRGVAPAPLCRRHQGIAEGGPPPRGPIPHALEAKADDGSLPLHLAAVCKAPLKVVRLLADRSPQAMGQKRGVGTE